MAEANTSKIIKLPNGIELDPDGGMATRKVSVIVRGFRDEPSELTAISRHGSKPMIAVVGADPSKPIGWPLASAFLFDAGLFGQMRAAFERGDNDALAALWQQAQPFRTDSLPTAHW
jgi:hypothetical protein